MFCAFDGPPKIVRLHGTGRVIEAGTPEFESLRGSFPANIGMRAIVRVSLKRISDSCGYAVPRYRHVADRDTLDRWAEAKGPDGLVRYRRDKNALSVDGLRGLDLPAE
jgi:hypothetical protein